MRAGVRAGQRRGRGPRAGPRRARQPAGRHRGAGAAGRELRRPQRDPLAHGGRRRLVHGLHQRRPRRLGPRRRRRVPLSHPPDSPLDGPGALDLRRGRRHQSPVLGRALVEPLGARVRGRQRGLLRLLRRDRHASRDERRAELRQRQRDRRRDQRGAGRALHARFGAGRRAAARRHRLQFPCDDRPRGHADRQRAALDLLRQLRRRDRGPDPVCRRSVLGCRLGGAGRRGRPLRGPRDRAQGRLVLPAALGLDLLRRAGLGLHRRRRSRREPDRAVPRSRRGLARHGAGGRHARAGRHGKPLGRPRAQHGAAGSRGRVVDDLPRDRGGRPLVRGLARLHAATAAARPARLGRRLADRARRVVGLGLPATGAGRDLRRRPGIHRDTAPRRSARRAAPRRLRRVRRPGARAAVELDPPAGRRLVAAGGRAASGRRRPRNCTRTTTPPRCSSSRCPTGTGSPRRGCRSRSRRAAAATTPSRPASWCTATTTTT